MLMHVAFHGVIQSDCKLCWSLLVCFRLFVYFWENCFHRAIYRSRVYLACKVHPCSHLRSRFPQKLCMPTNNGCQMLFRYRHLQLFKTWNSLLLHVRFIELICEIGQSLLWYKAVQYNEAIKSWLLTRIYRTHLNLGKVRSNTCFSFRSTSKCNLFRSNFASWSYFSSDQFDISPHMQDMVKQMSLACASMHITPLTSSIG